MPTDSTTTNTFNQEDSWTIDSHTQNIENQAMETDSWSRILLSDSESQRLTGTVYRQNDSHMVVLVRRLEYFPSLEDITKTRILFMGEIQRLEKVRAVVTTQSNQDTGNNPILTQALIEVESELEKITIERDAFNAKISAEEDLITQLIDIVVTQEHKESQKISTLLDLYDFHYNEKANRAVHVSNIEKKVPSTPKVSKEETDQANSKKDPTQKAAKTGK